MPTHSYLTDIDQPTGNAIDAVSNDVIYVAQGTSIAASNGSGIRGTQSITATLAGDVFGSLAGLYFTNAGGSNAVTVHKTGSASGGSYGILLYGPDNAVNNAGTISGFIGITLNDGGADLRNSGNILGEHFAIELTGADGTANHVFNSGSVVSNLSAINAGSAADGIINRGAIVGDIFLGSGDDLLDSRGGLLEGNVNLGGGNDTAWGSDGADVIDASGDNDIVRGRAGDDRLYGGGGKDTLVGGDGDDQFVFDVDLPVAKVDVIRDFVHAEDTIVLEPTVFTALGASVGKGEFLARASGHAAMTAGQHLIYDKSKGTLWYDADGAGGSAAVKFVQLGTTADHPTNLTFQDFDML